jgi:hypothetical protein
VTVLGVQAGDVAYWALAFFLVVVGVGSFFMLLKLGNLFGRVSAFMKGTERDLLPVIVKTGGTVDRINYQLDKADTVTDSAVSMAESADTAVRAVSHAISKPVEKLSGVAAGVTHGVGSLRKHRDLREAKTAFRQAAKQREADLADDLRRAGTPGTAPKPERTPPPAPQAKPEPTPRPAATAKPKPAPEPPADDAPTAA